MYLIRVALTSTPHSFRIISNVERLGLYLPGYPSLVASSFPNTKWVGLDVSKCNRMAILSVVTDFSRCEKLEEIDMKYSGALQLSTEMFQKVIDSPGIFPALRSLKYETIIIILKKLCLGAVCDCIVNEIYCDVFLVPISGRPITKLVPNK